MTQVFELILEAFPSDPIALDQRHPAERLADILEVKPVEAALMILSAPCPLAQVTGRREAHLLAVELTQAGAEVRLEAKGTAALARSRQLGGLVPPSTSTAQKARLVAAEIESRRRLRFHQI